MEYSFSKAALLAIAYGATPAKLHDRVGYEFGKSDLVRLAYGMTLTPPKEG